jgi:hypothetical protein
VNIHAAAAVGDDVDVVTKLSASSTVNFTQ